MPIKGLTDQPRLPRLGKVRLGEKVEPQGKPSYPRATPHFVVDKVVQVAFGEKPTELAIAFPTDDPESFASTWYRCYGSTRGKVCQGDGESAARLVDMDAPQGLSPVATRDTQHAEWRDVVCSPEQCPEYGKKQCRPVMCLQFLLPSVEGLGIWQIDTSSVNSIRNVDATIKLVLGTVGRISLIPFTLSLVPKEVTPEGMPKKTVHVLQLNAPYKFEDLFRYAALPPGRALLPPADLEPPDLEEEEEGAPTPHVVEMPDASLQRQKLWQAIRGHIFGGAATVSKDQVVTWLKREADINMVPERLSNEGPPDFIPTSVLTKMLDALAQRQLQLLGDPA